MKTLGDTEKEREREREGAGVHILLQGVTPCYTSRFILNARNACFIWCSLCLTAQITLFEVPWCSMFTWTSCRFILPLGFVCVSFFGWFWDWWLFDHVLTAFDLVKTLHDVAWHIGRICSKCLSKMNLLIAFKFDPVCEEVARAAQTLLTWPMKLSSAQQLSEHQLTPFHLEHLCARSSSERINRNICLYKLSSLSSIELSSEMVEWWPVGTFSCPNCSLDMFVLFALAWGGFASVFGFSYFRFAGYCPSIFVQSAYVNISRVALGHIGTYFSPLSRIENLVRFRSLEQSNACTSTSTHKLPADWHLAIRDFFRIMLPYASYWCYCKPVLHVD